MGPPQAQGPTTAGVLGDQDQPSQAARHVKGERLVGVAGADEAPLSDPRTPSTPAALSRTRPLPAQAVQIAQVREEAASTKRSRVSLDVRRVPCATCADRVATRQVPCLEEALLLAEGVLEGPKDHTPVAATSARPSQARVGVGIPRCVPPTRTAL